MAHAPDAVDRSLSSPQLEMTAHESASPAGITEAVVALLTPTLAATVETAVQRGLEQLHVEIQAQAQRLTHAEERISSLEDDNTAISDIFACLSNSHKDIWEKLDDLENHAWHNNSDFWNLFLLHSLQTYVPDPFLSNLVSAFLAL